MTEAASPGSPYRTPARYACDYDELIVPYDGQERMRLAIASGVSSARIHVDPSATALVVIDAGEALAPRLRVSSNEVRLGFDWSLGQWMRAILSGDHDLHITLHPAVAWELSVRGGASSLEADLSQGNVSRIDVNGGCSNLDLALPAPTQTVPIRISGGASHARIRRPEGVVVAVSVSGGISSLRLDDRAYHAIGGVVRLSSEGTGAPRYDVQVRGGASDVEVEKA